MRVKNALLPLLPIALIGLTACEFEEFGGMGHFSRDFHYSFPLQANGRLTVESFNGSIEISPWDQPTVDISGTKYGPTQDEAEALKIEVDHAADQVSVRAIRPYSRHGNRGAKFVIKIPRGAAVDHVTTSNAAIHASNVNGPARLKSSNGAIRVEGLHGRLDADTSNGAIELEAIDGDVVARTSNGHIHGDALGGGIEADSSNGGVTITVTQTSRPVRVTTSNGSVSLKLPPNFAGGVRAHTNNSSITVHMAEPAGAQLSAHTSNSSITTDFDIRAHGEIGKHDMNGQIGNGGGLMDLNTSNGSIRILKR